MIDIVDNILFKLRKFNINFWLFKTSTYSGPGTHPVAAQGWTVIVLPSSWSSPLSKNLYEESVSWVLDEIESIPARVIVNNFIYNENYYKLIFGKTQIGYVQRKIAKYILLNVKGIYLLEQKIYFENHFGKIRLLIAPF